jgi:hypothetical protein
VIEFDTNQLRVELVELKSVSTALGGSISVVDSDRSTKAREVYRRIAVPQAVARAFRERHKNSKYINPVWTAVIYYNNLVVALERHPLGAAGSITEVDENGKTHMWQPECMKNIDRIIAPLIDPKPNDWFFDGRYVYTFTSGSADAAVRGGEFLSSDKKFRAVEVEAIALHQLHNADKLVVEPRTCVAYVANNGEYALTPPIWKDVRTVGTKKTREDNEADDETDSFTFDKINEVLKVNLNFALSAAKTLSEHWGFEAIEPLNLPELMVRLRTVNLPGVSTSVKATYDCGMPFTTAMAWLMGYQRRAKSMDELLAVRALFKYLTSTGLFYGRMFQHAAVYRAGMSEEDIPMLTKDEAVHKMSKNFIELNKARTEEVLDRIRRRRGSTESATGNVVAGLMTEND